MQMPQNVLIAAGWVEFLIFLIIIGSSVIGQAVKAFQMKAEADRRRRAAEMARSRIPTGSTTPPRPPGDSRSKSNQGRVVQAKPVQAKVASKSSKGSSKQTPKRTEPARRVAPSAELGAELSLADERMESHLQQTFDHRLGQLGGPTTPIAQGTDAEHWRESSNQPQTALRVRELLASPQDLSAAFILSEILRRPEDRWSQER